MNNLNYELISEKYENANAMLKFKCFKCEDFFYISWDRVLRLSGCPVCHGSQIGTSNCLAIKYPNLIDEWDFAKNENLTPHDATCGSDKRVWWKCNCGHEWMSAIKDRVSGTSCLACTGRIPTVEHNLLAKNPELCKEWDYIKNKKRPEDFCPNSNFKAWWKCLFCDYSWEAVIHNRNKTRGTRCPKCCESIGENKIKLWLNENNLIFDREYISNGCKSEKGKYLKFDFAVFDDDEKTKLKALIEYDGEGHYLTKPFGEKSYNIITHNDKLKNKYCDFNNIKLIRIPYWEQGNIENILLEKL